MSPLAKLFVVVNLLLSLAFFGSSATLFATRVNWHQEAVNFRKDAEAKLAEVGKSYKTQGERLVQAEKDKERLNATVNSLTNDKKSLGGSLEEANRKIASGESRILTEVKEKTTLLSTQESLQKNNTDITKLLEAARKDAEEAKGAKELATNDMTRMRLDLDKAMSEYSKQLIEYNTLRSKAETMELQIAAAVKAGVNLEQFPTELPIDAVIQAVEQEKKLVVLSVGRDQKVQEGFKFTVYRGDRFVGKVQVVKVYEDLAGARILFTQENESIQIGDKAATQL
jgi:myosin heavy subunit